MQNTAGAVHKLTPKSSYCRGEREFWQPEPCPELELGVAEQHGHEGSPAEPEQVDEHDAAQLQRLNHLAEVVWREVGKEGEPLGGIRQGVRQEEESHLGVAGEWIKIQ